jgi:hypothetical protein
VLDETISREVLEGHVFTGGNFIGIGSRRPRRGGEFGRLRILSITKVEAERKLAA